MASVIVKKFEAELFDPLQLVRVFYNENNITLIAFLNILDRFNTHFCAVVTYTVITYFGNSSPLTGFTNSK
jgi:hypothetical protein